MALSSHRALLVVAAALTSTVLLYSWTRRSADPKPPVAAPFTCPTCPICPTCPSRPAQPCPDARETLETFEACRAKVNSAPVAPDVDWKFWNSKAETQDLIAEAGGLTSLMKSFMRVYETNRWKHGSGPGSLPAWASKTVCMLSHLLVPAFNVTVLVDFPCGDQQWAPMLRQRLSGVSYVGVDIMPGLVQRNRELYGNEKTEFFLADMSEENVFAKIRAQSKLWTDNSVVAVLSRHVLEHNFYNTSFAYLRNLKDSGAKYYIGTTSKINAPNPPVSAFVVGEFAAIDFYIPPFSFPSSMLDWQESDKTYTRTHIALWEVSKLPKDYPSL